LSSENRIDPDRTPIFHITHIDNLASIVSAGCLMSDSRHRRGEFGCTNIGHMNIKDRRMLRQVPVAAHGVLGDYVPFNFCGRSVMLCAIHFKRVAGYAGDDRSIVHLISTVGDASRCGRAWAFTDRHAELVVASYFDDLADLKQIDWAVMPLKYWGEEPIKETRQAEFLVHDTFPWTCIRWIGVHNASVQERISSILSTASHQPKMVVRPDLSYA
jgi:ssDNA thymidine ADP-ribosyltransferase, DarT